MAVKYTYNKYLIDQQYEAEEAMLKEFREEFYAKYGQI